MRLATKNIPCPFPFLAINEVSFRDIVIKNTTKFSKVPIEIVTSEVSINLSLMTVNSSEIYFSNKEVCLNFATDLVNNMVSELRSNFGKKTFSFANIDLKSTLVPIINNLVVNIKLNLKQGSKFNV